MTEAKLPELPGNQFWRVDRYGCVLLMERRDAKVGEWSEWGPGVLFPPGRTSRETRRRWDWTRFRFVREERYRINAPTTVETLGFERIDGKLTPEKIAAAAERILAHHTLIGDYPPKEL